MENLELQKLQARLATFVSERDWEQFHSPKNLAACLSVEAAELLELYMWTVEGPGPHPPGAGPPPLERVEEEIADVFLCLMNLCSALDLNLLHITERKLEALARKYPLELSKGTALKSPGLQPEKNSSL